MSFLHGIEHLELPADFTPVNDIVTAVIGLIGVSDEGPENELTLCYSSVDDKQFGTEGTIPQALRAIRAQDSARGNALVFVVRVPEDEDRNELIKGIVGETDANGEKTGLAIFETAFSLYGFEPMIYIAPGFSHEVPVLEELMKLCRKQDVMAYIDTPEDYTFNDANTCKGTDGDFAGIESGQKLLFPQFSALKYGSTDEYENVPMSAYAAGLRARIDLEEGWHVSSSNHKIYGVKGLSLPLTFGLSDISCQVNMLNANGITTAVNMFGTGIVEWGNYTAGYPADMNSDSFECVRRTRAIMKRAVEQAAIPFLDKPFIQANVDAIRNTVNQYLNGLKAQGKIIEGQCIYNPENNTVDKLAQGHITFDIEFTPALPMQRLSFSYKIDLSSLSTIE